jgi:glutaredoxin
MEIKVFGKQNCGLCESAKGKLKMMGIPFEVFELTDFTQPHEGWRTDGSVELLACYSDIDTLPVVMIDGKAMSYPAAMRALKDLKPSKKKADAIVVDFKRPAPVESELELALA